MTFGYFGDAMRPLRMGVATIEGPWYYSPLRNLSYVELLSIWDRDSI